MKLDKQKKIVWLYQGDHTKHPFIGLALKSLVEAGFTLSIVDLAPERIKAPYRHVPVVSPLPGSIRTGYSVLMSITALAHLLWKRPGIIIATLPMMAALGWLAARMLGSRLVYYPFELFGEQGVPVSAFMKKLEMRVLSKGIDALITQNQERARIYVQERNARVGPVIVHNYKQKRTASPSGKLRDLLKLPPDCRIVLYEGILNKGRCLEQLVQAAAYLPEKSRLVLMGEINNSWWKSTIEPVLNNRDIAQKVLVAPWVPHNDLLEYVADADVGILIYDSNARNSLYCEPGKLSDYVFAGIPVAASHLPTLEPVIHRYGIGDTFINHAPEEISRVIKSILSVPKSVWQPALKKAGEDLAWETQVNTFIEAVTGKQQ